MTLNITITSLPSLRPGEEAPRTVDAVLVDFQRSLPAVRPHDLLVTCDMIAGGEINEE